jgi:hypothetical protein
VGTVKHTATTVVDLHYGGETVTATPNHPFWEVRRRDWVDAGELVVGDQLLAANGSVVPLEQVAVRHGQFTVYNLEVEGQHTYFVGKTGVLVHNGPPGNPCAAPPPKPLTGRPHGSPDHDAAIDAEIADMPQGSIDPRKNQAQVDAAGNKVGNNRPDLQYTDPKTGERVNVEVVDSNPDTHAGPILTNDPKAILIILF